MLPPTQVHEHSWELIGTAANIPLQDGGSGSYHLYVCWHCQYVKPEPSEIYLMSTNDHKESMALVLAEKHLIICYNGVES